jgi:hypothetical protein
MAQRELAKKDEAMIVQMYKEIQEVVSGYAAQNNLSAVLTYTEPTTKEEAETSGNIQRKLKASGQLGALSPIYIAPGMDISGTVVTMLNSRYQPPTQGIVPAGATTTQPGTRQ